MKPHLRSFLIGTLASLLLLATVEGSSLTTASRPHPAPPPPPPGVHLFDYLDLNRTALGFSVADTLTGSGFSPGEHVTVTAAPAVIRPTPVTADETGAFKLSLRFHWVFFGPNASTHPRPVFTAAGDHGDVAHTTPVPEECPVVAAEPGTDLGIGTVGTDFITGFGFRPREKVTLRLNGPEQDASASTAVKANAEGEIAKAVAIHIAPPCTGDAYLQLLLAEGALGTSVVASLVASPAPTGFCPPPPTSVVAIPLGATVASLRLSRATARPGRYERAAVEQMINGTVSLVIHYPRHRTTRLSASTAPDNRVTIRWRIPRDAAPGVAHVLLSDTTEPQAPVPAIFHIQR